MKLEKLLLAFIVFIAVFLRFYHVDTNPPGLYIDEVSIGYNAYKVLTTGKDEHGEQYPLFFKSFGDYKMPIYIYTVSASMAVFGKNEFAIRFPAIASGTLSVIVLYFFLKELFFPDKKKYSATYVKHIPLLSSLLLAISSWHIQFSRGGFEVTLAVFLFLLASWLITLFWKTQKLAFLWSSYFFYVLAMYSYHVFRIITPIVVIVLSIIIYRKFLKQRRGLLLSVVLFFLIALPLILFSFSSYGSERFSQTSSFAEYKADSLVEKIKTYPIVYIRNYLSFFSFDFLFTFGDGIGRHQMPGFGLLYRWQLPFLLIGIFFLLKQKKSLLRKVVFWLLLLSPVAASVARPSPHSLRVLLMVIPLTIFIAFGIISVFEKRKILFKFTLMAVLFIAIFEFSMYLHHYYAHYPRVNIKDWDGGYKQIIQEVTAYEVRYKTIVVDANFDLPYTYFLFYNENLKPYYVSISWVKPREWDDRKILYVRRYYGENKTDNIIHNVYLPNQNKDIVAQFWEL